MPAVEGGTKTLATERRKPENTEKRNAAASAGEPKVDPLLTEQTVSNKEQRRADWAIMKEMARYLWPKVD